MATVPCQGSSNALSVQVYLVHALRQTTTASKDVHGCQRKAILLLTLASGCGATLSSRQRRKLGWWHRRGLGRGVVGPLDYKDIQVSCVWGKRQRGLRGKQG